MAFGSDWSNLEEERQANRVISMKKLPLCHACPSCLTSVEYDVHGISSARWRTYPWFLVQECPCSGVEFTDKTRGSGTLLNVDRYRVLRCVDSIVPLLLGNLVYDDWWDWIGFSLFPWRISVIWQPSLFVFFFLFFFKTKTKKLKS